MRLTRPSSYKVLSILGPVDEVSLPATRHRYANDKDERYNPRLARKLKLFERDKFTCKLCGAVGVFFIRTVYPNNHKNTAIHVVTDNHSILTIDHINPRCKDGTDGLHNLQTLCECCNNNKGHL